MASTRSTQRTPRRQPSTSADAPRDALAALARRAARMQIAGGAAAVMSFAGWAQAVDRLAQTVGDELLRRVDGESDSAELVVRLSKATSSHLHELSTLPRTAADHFHARLAADKEVHRLG
jgi:hypothetical protein